MIPGIAARIAALSLVLTLAACSSPQQAANDKLKPMVGSSEAALVAGMGRAPDAIVEQADGVRLMQWRRDKTYAVPNALLFYQYAGGATRPIANSPFGIVEGCTAEWTVKNGVATGYRWSGFDCP